MKHAHLILALIAALFISACGGGGGGAGTPGSGSSAYVPPPVTFLQGVAAVGYPIAGGTVQIKCAGGSPLSTTTGSTGDYYVSLSGQTLPCAVQVSGGTINSVANISVYHSITYFNSFNQLPWTGHINITPITNLLLANLIGTATPDVWFSSLSNTNFPTITTAALNTAQQNAHMAFSGIPAGIAFEEYLAAMPGNIGDDKLAALQVAMTSTGISYTDLLAAAATPGFSSAAVTTLNAALPAAWASTISGSKPTVTSISPNSGTIGTTVTITGTNFITTNFSTSTVTFGGGAVVTGADLVSLTANQIVVRVPAGSTTGAIAIQQSPAGPSVNTSFFTVGPVISGLMGGAIQGTPLDSPTVVTTLAGAGYGGGLADGIGAAAGFGGPSSITTDGRNLYVVDNGYCLIRKVEIATSAVSTFAGSHNAATLTGSGCPLDLDGVGTAASFNRPVAITTDGANLYVTDSGNGGAAIRKIVIATGMVTTLATSSRTTLLQNAYGATASFAPDGITTDGINLFVPDSYSVRKVSIASGSVAILAGGSQYGSLFLSPSGMTTDGVNLYVADSGNNKIRKIVIATGVVTTLAGSGAAGAADGIGAAALFDYPRAVTTDGTNLYVADRNNKIRKIAIASGEVTTLAGSGVAGAVDGTGATASFNQVYGLTTDGGFLYAADSGSLKIRRIAPPTTVTGMNPSTGITGTAVTITGTNFDTTAANNTVSFNGTPAIVTSATATSITASVPFGATTGLISVATVKGGLAVSTGIFTVGLPTVATMSSSTGIAGTSVTITGTNFDVTPANNTVRFNGTPATVTASTATSITTTVPSGATTGSVSVTTAGGTASSAGTFTIGLLPTVTSMNPSTGSAGTSVTLTGTNFDITPANNTVRFNGTPATVTASTSTSITATVPNGATTGIVSVTTSGGTTTSAGSFTVSTGGGTTGGTTGSTALSTCLSGVAYYPAGAYDQTFYGSVTGSNFDQVLSSRSWLNTATNEGLGFGYTKRPGSGIVDDVAIGIRCLVGGVSSQANDIWCQVTADNTYGTSCASKGIQVNLTANTITLTNTPVTIAGQTLSLNASLSPASAPPSTGGGSVNCDTAWTGNSADIQVSSLCLTACSYQQIGNTSAKTSTCAILGSYGTTATNSCTVCR